MGIRFNNIYEFPEARHVMVCGDIHGDFKSLVFKFCIENAMTDTLVIVAGDCGFGFQRPDYYKDIYTKLSSRLAKANNWVVFVRGNHDNPAYFNGKQVNSRRWKAVPDYSVLRACGHSILCVGGAISVDRGWRKYEQYIIEEEEKYGKLMPYVYWPDEVPVYDEAQLKRIDEGNAIDVVVTHTAPSFCEKKSRADIQGWLVRDENLLNDVIHERQVMDDIHAYLTAHHHPLQQWFYGHFHKSWYSRIDGVDFHLLDSMEMREVKGV